MTTQTIQGRLLLMPSRILDDIVCGLLARADRYPVELVEARRPRSGQYGRWRSGLDWANDLCREGYAVTAPSGSFAANGYGLFGIVGTVWKWVEDS